MRPYRWMHSEEDDTRHLEASDLYHEFSQPDYRGEKGQLCEYINRTIDHQGTHQAYVNLIERKADLILVAREPSSDERQHAEVRGVELDVQPVALDAFVFLLNSKNPISNLTLPQHPRYLFRQDDQLGAAWRS